MAVFIFTVWGFAVWTLFLAIGAALTGNVWVACVLGVLVGYNFWEGYKHLARNWKLEFYYFQTKTIVIFERNVE